MVELTEAINATSQVVTMVVETATETCGLLMEPPIVFVVGFSVAAAGFAIVRSFFRRKVR